MLRGVAVLIVDDNATNRMILRELALKWEMKPTLCESGEEALTLLQFAHSQGTPFPLVLLDSQMPGMSGFEVAEHLREKAHLGHAMVIMLTSAGLRGEGARCRALGIRAYLPKPARRADLLEAMKLILSMTAAGGGCARVERDGSWLGDGAHVARTADATAGAGGGRQCGESGAGAAIAGEARTHGGDCGEWARGAGGVGARGV